MAFPNRAPRMRDVPEHVATLNVPELLGSSLRCGVEMISQIHSAFLLDRSPVGDFQTSQFLDSHKLAVQ